MKITALCVPTLCLASFLAVAGLAACTDAKPLKKDTRLDETGHFTLNWPLKATSLEGAVAEVETGIGPGLKRADGMIEWTAQVDATHCARIQLKNDGANLSANSERLMQAHPDFDACISGK